MQQMLQPFFLVWGEVPLSCLDCHHRKLLCGGCSIKEETQAVATFLSKSDGVVAGLGVVDMVAQEVDPAIQVRNCAACAVSAVCAGG